MTKDETLKLALEALEQWHFGCGAGSASHDDAVAAIKEALAQPQQEPLTNEEELSNGFSMALHDAMLIRIGADDEATQQATARIDKLVNKYKIEVAHNIKE